MNDLLEQFWTLGKRPWVRFQDAEGEGILPRQESNVVQEGVGDFANGAATLSCWRRHCLVFGAYSQGHWSHGFPVHEMLLTYCAWFHAVT